MKAFPGLRADTYAVQGTYWGVMSAADHAFPGLLRLKPEECQHHLGGTPQDLALTWCSGSARMAQASLPSRAPPWSAFASFTRRNQSTRRRSLRNAAASMGSKSPQEYAFRILAEQLNHGYGGRGFSTVPGGSTCRLCSNRRRPGTSLSRTSWSHCHGRSDPRQVAQQVRSAENRIVVAER